MFISKITTYGTLVQFVNCLEGFNRLFKLHHTHYKRQNLSVFKDSMLDFVHQRSAEYIQDRPFFVDSCVVNNELLFTGWEYSFSQKSFVSANHQNSVVFYVFAGNNMEKISIPSRYISINLHC